MRTRIYPLAQAGDPPATEFLNFSAGRVQRRPRQRLLLLRGGRLDRRRRARRRARPRARRAARRDRDRRRQAVRARRADALDPRRGGADRGRHRAQPGVRAARPRRLLLPRQHVGDRVRRRQPRVPGQRRPAARRPRDDALRRHRHHPGHDPRRRRRRLPVRVHRPRRQRRLARRRPRLHAHPARRHPRQDLLGDRHLRPPDPLAAADRQPLPQHPQRVRGHAHRGQRRPHHRLRPDRARGTRRQLDPDPSPTRAGSRSCASTDHWSPGSTRPGDPERSNPPTRRRTAGQEPALVRVRAAHGNQVVRALDPAGVSEVGAHPQVAHGGRRSSSASIASRTSSFPMLEMCWQ